MEQRQGIDATIDPTFPMEHDTNDKSELLNRGNLIHKTKMGNPDINVSVSNDDENLAARQLLDNSSATEDSKQATPTTAALKLINNTKANRTETITTTTNIEASNAKHDENRNIDSESTEGCEDSTTTLTSESENAAIQEEHKEVEANPVGATTKDNVSPHVEQSSGTSQAKATETIEKHHATANHTENQKGGDSIQPIACLPATVESTATAEEVSEGTKRRNKKLAPMIAKSSPRPSPRRGSHSSRRGSNSSVQSTQSIGTVDDNDDNESDEDEVIGELRTTTVMIPELGNLSTSTRSATGLPPGVSAQTNHVPLARMSSQLRRAVPLPEKLPANKLPVSASSSLARSPSLSVAPTDPSIPLPGAKPRASHVPLPGEKKAELPPTPAEAALRIQAHVRGSSVRNIGQTQKKKQPPLPGSGPSLVASKATSSSSIPLPQQKPPKPGRATTAQSTNREAMEKLEVELERCKEENTKNLQQLHGYQLSLQQKIEEMAEKETSFKKLESKLKAQSVEIVHLRDELKSEEESFEKLEKLVADREAKHAEKERQLAAALVKQEELEIEVRKQRTKLYSQEEHMKRLMPETEDVCLSARSFSENQSIQLREDTIKVRDEQLVLVEAHTVKLNDSIDVLEAELHKVQNELMHRDIELNKVKSVNKTFSERIRQLEARVKVDNAQEAAVSAISKQNIELVQVLRGSEKQFEEVVAEKAKLVDAVASLEVKCKELQTKCAQFEADAKVHNIQAVKVREQHDNVQRLLDTNSRIANEKLENVVNTYEARITALESDLTSIRETHYKTLDRVQSMESEVAQARANERTWQQNAQLVGSKVASANADSDARLGRVLELEGKVDRLESLNSDLEMKCVAIASEKDLVAKQLLEMRKTVGRGVESQEKLQKEASALRSSVTDLKLQEEELKQRLLREGNLQGKRRVRAELEVKSLNEQLVMLQTENKELASAFHKISNSSTETKTKLEARCQLAVRHLKAEEQANQLRFPKLLLAVYDAACISLARCELAESALARTPSCRTATNNSSTSTENEQLWCILHLDECKLSISNLTDISKFVMWFQPSTFSHEMLRAGVSSQGSRGSTRRTRAPGLRLDLRCNAIHDATLPPLLNCLEFASVPLHLDLRGNHISMEGVRLIAKAMEANTKYSIGVAQVYVHKSGLVEAYGRLNSSEGGRSNNGRPNSMHSKRSFDRNNRFKVLVVDVRENHTFDQQVSVEDVRFPQLSLPSQTDSKVSTA